MISTSASSGRLNRLRVRRALMLADGFRLQYRVLRCAAMCFSDVYVLGTSEAAVLRRSSTCAGFFLFTGSFRDMDPGAIEQINALCRKLSIDYVLPSCAETTRFLAVYGSCLEALHYPVPSREVFDTLDDKWRFAGLCKELMVPHPRTDCYASYRELQDAAERGQLSYPIIMKPLGMWGSFGVMKIDERSGMPKESKYEPILVQDYFPGQDFCAFYLCRDGRVIRSISYIRNAHSITFGSNPEVNRYAAIIIERLRYNGVIGFDVRRAPDGAIAFIECNPRFWYRMDLALIAGLNVVEAGCAEDLETTLPQPEVYSGITLQSPRTLVRNTFLPWRLSHYDVEFIKYLFCDPILNTWAAVRSLLGANKGAKGQIFLCMLLFGSSRIMWWVKHAAQSV